MEQTLGKRIMQNRKRLGLTQDQLADKLHAEGKDAAADQIRKAVDEFKKGNLYLGLALATVKEQ